MFVKISIEAPVQHFKNDIIVDLHDTLYIDNIIIIIIYLPKMQVHKNSCKHSCSGKTYQAHISAHGSLN